MRAGELTVVGGEQYGGVVGEAEFVDDCEDAADLLVDERDVAPVRRDEFTPAVRADAVVGPVRRIVLLDARFAGERLGYGGGKLDARRVVPEVVGLGQQVRKVGAEPVA